MYGVAYCIYNINADSFLNYTHSLEAYPVPNPAPNPIANDPMKNNTIEHIFLALGKTIVGSVESRDVVDEEGFGSMRTIGVLDFLLLPIPLRMSSLDAIYNSKYF